MLFKLLHQKNILHSKNIYAHQQEEKHWITETLLDKEIDQLNISQNKRSHKKNIKLKIAMLGRKQKNRKS